MTYLLQLTHRGTKQLGASAVEYGLVLAVITAMVMAGGKMMGVTLEGVMVGAGQTIKTLAGGGSNNSSSNNSADTQASNTPPDNEVAMISIARLCARNPKACGIVAGTTWKIPKQVLNKIPKSWGNGSPNKKGTGSRWQDPKNEGNGVRIDKGNPNNSQVTQRNDHVIVRKNGKIIGRNGKPIKGKVADNPHQAHIPLGEYQKWRTWDAP